VADFFLRSRCANVGHGAEGPGQHFTLNHRFNAGNELSDHHLGKSSLKSRNFGFINRISASFFSRRQLLICFSRRMVDLGWPYGSK